MNPKQIVMSAFGRVNWKGFNHDANADTVLDALKKADFVVLRKEALEEIIELSIEIGRVEMGFDVPEDKEFRMTDLMNEINGLKVGL